MFMECRFVKANGLKCQSPAMRGSSFCYFHARTRAITSRCRRRNEDALTLPELNGRSGLLDMINGIVQAIAANAISPERARSLLYALQLAQKSLHDFPFLDRIPDECGPDPEATAAALLSALTRPPASVPPASS